MRMRVHYLFESKNVYLSFKLNFHNVEEVMYRFEEHQSTNLHQSYHCS